MKISNFTFELPKPQIADYVKIVQRVLVAVFTLSLAFNQWFVLPLVFLLFVQIDVKDELQPDCEEPEPVPE